MNMDSLVQHVMHVIDERSEIPAVVFEPIRVDPNVVDYMVSAAGLRPITERLMYRPPTDRDDVKDAHDRFRRCYLRNGTTMSLCRCMAHVEPHLHAPRRLRRIGHLPMMTMKELPE